MLILFISYLFSLLFSLYKKGGAFPGFALFVCKKIRGWGLCPQLLKGDCLEIMKEIPESAVDMVLCDLPYQMTDCAWDKIIPFPELWGQYHRIIKENGAIVLFSAQPFTTKLIYSNLKHFRYCWYWKKNNKTGFSYAKYQPMRCIEDICVFYKKMPTYNPQGLKRLENGRMKKGLNSNVDGIYKAGALSKKHTQKYTGYPVHVLEFKKDATNKNRLHPTQKPVALLEYLIKTYTSPGEVVLDNCMGSGSTGEAAINTGRKFIGIEKDEHYFNVAKERIRGVVENVNPETGEILSEHSNKTNDTETGIYKRLSKGGELEAGDG